MQIKIFTIPIYGGEKINEEMNVFLRSKKVLQVESHLVKEEKGAFWCFCIKYLDDTDIPSPRKGKKKPDYKEILDPQSFERFTKMRAIRKQIADDEGIPAYAIFTNNELAELAKIDDKMTLAKMKGIKGIGTKKIEKYGQYFINSQDSNEKS